MMIKINLDINIDKDKYAMQTVKDEVFGYDVICPFYFKNEKGGDTDDRKR